LRVCVVGSGPAGAAAAQALLRAGLEVEMLDAGREPDAASEALAKRIREQVAGGGAPDPEIRRELKHGPHGSGGGLFRGIRSVLGGSVDAQRVEKRVLGSTFVFDGVADGIPLAPVAIPRSLSRGGLSNVWGAACYAWRSDDFSHWPIGAEALSPWYAAASELLGLVQQEDDLARAYPVFGSAAPVESRNPGSAAERLLAHWSRHRDGLAQRGFSAGRARVAVRPTGAEGDACRRCGLCVYGCAFGAIYSSRRSLPDLERRGLRYRGGTTVHAFREDEAGVRVRWRDRAGAAGEDRYEAVFLAAGTLSSLRIAADSLGLHDRSAPLLDNDMLLLPLVLTSALVGGRFRSCFTLGEAVLALDPGRVSGRGLHLQIYSFHEYFLAELGPLLARLPRPLEDLLWWPLNNLLVSFTYLAGSESRAASGRVRRGDPIGRIEVEERPHPQHAVVVKQLLRLLWRSRADLGFVPLAPLAKLAPFGFSGHLAGSLPMRRAPGPLETHVDGRLDGTRRVYVVDAAAFPDLPAQNLTYTIAANALRVATGFASRVPR
jgi:choline dehydrogenase-like flavoprotein